MISNQAVELIAPPAKAVPDAYKIMDAVVKTYGFSRINPESLTYIRTMTSDYEALAAGTGYSPSDCAYSYHRIMADAALLFGPAE